MQSEPHQCCLHQEVLPSVTTPLSLLLLAGGAGGASVSPSVTSSLYLRQCTAAHYARLGLAGVTV